MKIEREIARWMVKQTILDASDCGYLIYQSDIENKFDVKIDDDLLQMVRDEFNDRYSFFCIEPLFVRFEFGEFVFDISPGLGWLLASVYDEYWSIDEAFANKSEDEIESYIRSNIESLCKHISKIDGVPFVIYED